MSNGFRPPAGQWIAVATSSLATRGSGNAYESGAPAPTPDMARANAAR